MGIISKLTGGLWSFLGDALNFISNLAYKLFSALLEGLGSLFRPLLEFLGAIFYFLYKVGVVLLEVLKVVLYVGKLVVGLAIGIFKTVTGWAAFDGGNIYSHVPRSYQPHMEMIGRFLEQVQADKIIPIFYVSIWVATGIAALRIIRSMGGAAE